MKLRFLGSRNPSAIYRYPIGIVPEETETEDNTAPLDGEAEQGECELADDGVPDDTGNRLPTGGRTGKPKIDKFQGYKIPPMY